MTTICFVRHGETDWNVAGKLQGKTDIPLNENGIAQAKECAAYLKEREWDAIITSPLKRAKGTAEIINEAIGLSLIDMDAFMERSFGDAEGMTYEERIAAFSENNYPNQEELAAFRERLMRGIEAVHADFTGKRVLLVAHGAVINAILAVLSNGEIGSGVTSLHNACLTTLVRAGDVWDIESYNQITHLTTAQGKTALIL